MKLVVLTKPEIQENEHEIIDDLFKAGMQHLHIRKPNLSHSKLKEFIQDIPAKYYRKITIHSHYQLATEFDLRGIHVTKKDKKNPLGNWLSIGYYKLFHPKLKLSTTFYSTSNLPFKSMFFDYVVLGNVFKSRSKKRFKSHYNWSDLERMLKKSNTSVYALGGVTKGRIQESKLLGFSGTVVMGAIWDSTEPISAFKEIQEFNQKAKSVFR